MEVFHLDISGIDSNNLHPLNNDSNETTFFVSQFEISGIDTKELHSPKKAVNDVTLLVFHF